MFDSTLAADLSELQEDIVSHDTKRDDEEEGEEYSKQPYHTACVVLRSQPTEKFYIETDGKTRYFIIVSSTDLRNFQLKRKQHS